MKCISFRGADPADQARPCPGSTDNAMQHNLLTALAEATGRVFAPARCLLRAAEWRASMNILAAHIICRADTLLERLSFEFSVRLRTFGSFKGVEINSGLHKAPRKVRTQIVEMKIS